MIKKRSKKIMMLAATLVASVLFVVQLNATKVSLKHAREIANDVNALLDEFKLLNNPNVIDGVTFDVSSLEDAVKVVEDDIKGKASTAQALLQ